VKETISGKMPDRDLERTFMPNVAAFANRHTPISDLRVDLGFATTCDIVRAGYDVSVPLATGVNHRAQRTLTHSKGESVES